MFPKNFTEDLHLMTNLEPGRKQDAVSGVTLWKLAKLPTEDAHSSFPWKSDAYVHPSIQNIHTATSSKKLAPNREMETARFPRDAGTLSSNFPACSWNSMVLWNVTM
jgi:hypothetical protein